MLHCHLNCGKPVLCNSYSHCGHSKLVSVTLCPGSDELLHTSVSVQCLHVEITSNLRRSLVKNSSFLQSPLSFGIHCTAYKVLFHTCNSVAHAHMYSWDGQAIAVEWPARCRDIQIQKIIVRGVFFYCLVDQTGVWCIVLSFQFKGKNTLLSMSEPGSSVHEMEKGWRQCMPVTKIADCKMLLSSNCISENKMYVHTDTDIDTHRQTHTQLYKLTKW